MQSRAPPLQRGLHANGVFRSSREASPAFSSCRSSVSPVPSLSDRSPSPFPEVHLEDEARSGLPHVSPKLWIMAEFSYLERTVASLVQFVQEETESCSSGALKRGDSDKRSAAMRESGLVGLAFDDDYKVIELVPCSPADDSGLILVGDQLVSVDGQDVQSFVRAGASSDTLLSGPVGSYVELVLSRGESIRSQLVRVSLQRTSRSIVLRRLSLRHDVETLRAFVDSVLRERAAEEKSQCASCARLKTSNTAILRQMQGMTRLNAELFEERNRFSLRHAELYEELERAKSVTLQLSSMLEEVESAMSSAEGAMGNVESERMESRRSTETLEQRRLSSDMMALEAENRALKAKLLEDNAKLEEAREKMEELREENAKLRSGGSKSSSQSTEGSSSQQKQMQELSETVRSLEESWQDVLSVLPKPADASRGKKTPVPPALPQQGCELEKQKTLGSYVARQLDMLARRLLRAAKEETNAA
eukprot:745999-Hanusia_phi.AAC.2